MDRGFWAVNKKALLPQFLQSCSRDLLAAKRSFTKLLIKLMCLLYQKLSHKIKFGCWYLSALNPKFLTPPPTDLKLSVERGEVVEVNDVL